MPLGSVSPLSLVTVLISLYQNRISQKKYGLNSKDFKKKNKNIN